MGPDNFVKQPNSQPREAYQPQQRLQNGMVPQRPARPTQGFSSPNMRPMQPMRPIPQRPIQNTQQNPYPDPGMRPTNQQRPDSPYGSFQQDFRRQPQAHQSQPFQPAAVSGVNTDFSPKNSPHQKPKKRFAISKPSKLSFVLGTVMIMLIAGLTFTSFGRDTAQPKAKAQNTAPTQKPLESPSFTPYFPSSLPDGLSVVKGSLSYYKESFTFILEQGGQKSFFVYEQPASLDPDLANLKTKLAAPQNISLSVGQGIEGSLDNGTVTAVKTDKNTVLIINCTKAVCSTAPRDILSSMQVSTDLDGLRQKY
jgi:hypothetical protein